LLDRRYAYLREEVTVLTKEKEFMTLEEAAQYTGKKRASIYNYIRDMDIKTHKFKRDRRVFLSMEDVKRIKELEEQPWKAGEEKR
jgi:predicted DNA-binding transcriptional regulator AlpA